MKQHIHASIIAAILWGFFGGLDSPGLSAEGLPFSGSLSQDPLSDNRTDLRHGGVLEESYATRQQAASYQYGFPVETYRWGWFGAGRYSPRVLWGRGYYGDKLRWAYRRGY